VSARYREITAQQDLLMREAANDTPAKFT
jgi:DNA primase